MRVHVLVASVAAAFVFVAMADAAMAQQRPRGRHQTMEQCVGLVLGRLAKANAPEAQVGPAIVSQCDGPLRERLAAAIASGQAASCTVETCMDMARSRAASEATLAYRDHLSRR